MSIKLTQSLTALLLLSAACPIGVVAQTLQFQVRADSGVTLNGSNVSQWDDLSGNGRHAVQASAAMQPEFIASHPGINGEPVVRFDGAKWLDFDGTFLAGTGYTIFVVEGRNPVDPPNTFGNFFLAGSGGVNANLLLGYENNTLLRLSHFGNDLDAVVPPFIVQEFNLWTFSFDPSVGRRIYQNGDSTPIASDGNMTTLSSYAGASIGHFPAFPAFAYFGDISEIRIYTGALNDMDRQAIEDELNGRYGTPVELMRFTIE